MKHSCLAAALLLVGAAGANAAKIDGVLVGYVPIYLNAASGGDGYIDQAKGPVQAQINTKTGFKLRNKGLPPAVGAGTDERAHRIYFNFGSTLSGASNLVLRAGMIGVPAHAGTWRLVVIKTDGTSASYACNFTDTSSNCFDGTDRLIRLASVAGAAGGYIEVEAMPSGSEVTFQNLRFTINDDGNAGTRGANEYDLVLSYK